MKRYLLLFAATAGIIASIFMAGNSFKKQAVSVQTWKIAPVTASNTVLCSGTVQRAKEKNVTVSKNSVVVEMFVQIGDVVKAGDSLFSVRASAAETEPPSEETYLTLWEEYQKTGVIPTDAESILAEAEAGEKATDEGKESQEQDTIVKSPISGTITEVNAGAGDTVSFGETVVKVSDSQNLQVHLQVNESTISKIQTGQTATISGAGFPGIAYQGEVVSISDEATQQASTAGKETVVEVLLKVLNPTEEIKPGYSVKASIVTEEIPDTLLIPYQAILADEDGQEYVYLAKGHQAVKQPITAEREYTDGVTIRESLPQGAELILEPDKVQDGAYLFCQEVEISDIFAEEAGT